MKSAFLRSIDDPDVIVRIDLEPLEDRRQVVRSLPALAFDDRATGPIDEFEVVLDLVGDGALGIIARYQVGVRT